MTEETPVPLPVINQQQVEAVVDVLAAALDMMNGVKGVTTPDNLLLRTWPAEKAVSNEVILAALAEVLAVHIGIVAEDDPRRGDGMLDWVRQRAWQELHSTFIKTKPRPDNIIPLGNKPETEPEEPT